MLKKLGKLMSVILLAMLFVCPASAAESGKVGEVEIQDILSCTDTGEVYVLEGKYNRDYLYQKYICPGTDWKFSGYSAEVFGVEALVPVQTGTYEGSGSLLVSFTYPLDQESFEYYKELDQNGYGGGGGGTGLPSGTYYMWYNVSVVSRAGKALKGYTVSKQMYDWSNTLVTDTQTTDSNGTAEIWNYGDSIIGFGATRGYVKSGDDVDADGNQIGVFTSEIYTEYDHTLTVKDTTGRVIAKITPKNYSNTTFVRNCRTEEVEIDENFFTIKTYGNYSVEISAEVSEDSDYNPINVKVKQNARKDINDLKVSLSYTKTTYSGSQKTPTVTIVDENGIQLSKGSNYDYTVSFAKDTRKAVGRYKVTVTGVNGYKGTKTLWFTITPKAPSTASAVLYGYDDVKVSWSKSTGATGYTVSYKKYGAADSTYKTLGSTTKLYYNAANLEDGVKYTFKIVPYYTSSSGTKYTGLQLKTTTATTLKKIATPSVMTSSLKVKVAWTNIAGETGYQISQSTSKTGTKIVATYATTTGNTKTVSATKGTTYYYKVRAYKTVNGTKIYGPWSTAVKYKR